MNVLLKALNHFVNQNKVFKTVEEIKDIYFLVRPHIVLIHYLIGFDYVRKGDLD